MANKFQTKRTTISGRTPNTTNSGNTHFIDTGELALNLTDGKMFSSNGSVYFEVGANLANQTVSGNANVGKLNVTASDGDEGGEIFLAAPANTTLSGGITIDAYQNKIRFFEQGGNARGAFIDLTACANGVGTNLLSGGSGGTGTVTSVDTGNGLTGGPITGSGTISVVANNGIIANSTGVFANAGTGVVVNATGIHVNSSYVQNTDSRTLSGNLVISGTYFNPSANTTLLGNSISRWIVSANTGDFSGTLTVGTSFIANSSQLTLTGIPLSANGSTGAAGEVLHSNGATGSPYWSTVTGGGFTNGQSISVANLVITGSLTANGSTGIDGQILASNGTSLYWTTQSSGSGAFVSRTYTGTGACTDFTVTNGVSNNSLLVMENGIVQTPSTDYSVSGATLTFTTAPANTVNIQIRELAVVATLDAANSYTVNNLTTVSTLTVGNSTVNSVINSTSISANTGNFTGTVSHTLTGTATTGGAQIYLNGDTLNRIDFNTSGVAPPAYTTRSAGTKIALYPAITGSSVDYALGVDSGALWTSIPGADAGQFFKWYGGETQVGSLSGTGMMNITGAANAASHTVGSDFIANSTAIVGTGYANITTSVNSASLTVGTSFIANSSQLTLTGIPLFANGSTGTAGQTLHSNGTTGSPYWAFVDAGTGIVANATGIHVNSSYIATISANNSSFLGGTAAASYVQNTDSRTLSGNLEISGTYFNPSANTVLLGNNLQRWVLSANTGDFSGAITSSGGVNPASNSTGTALGSSTARWVLNANSGDFTANIAMNSNYITGLSDPSNPQDAATKAYVDTFQEGLHIHESVAAATTDTLATLTGGTVTYNNGTSGVGANLVMSVALTTLDGYTLVTDDRIIVKNEANTAHNGIYTINADKTVLTRATDYDTAVNIAGGDFTFITNGTLYNSTGWVQIDEVTTIGTDPIEFVQFSGKGSFTAGNYLYLVDNQFNANATSTSTASVLIARDESQNFAANTANLVTINAGTINATSNGLIANSTTITVGNSSVNVTVTPSTIDLGTEFDANSTGLYHTGVVNAASYTTSGFVANTTAIAPTSNTILLGNSIGRFIVSANTVDASGTLTSNTVILRGSAASFTTTISPTTPTADRIVTIPDESFTIGFRNIPPVGTKTSSYSLTASDVGKYVQIGSGGSITIPDGVFSEGDAINIVNNTSADATITCSITTAYIAGTDTDKDTLTLATRGMATILFLSSTVCIVVGNVT